MSRAVKITLAFIVVMIGALGAVTFILSNFERLADEDFVAETDPGFVNIAGLTAPVSLDRALAHYVLIDIRLKIVDEDCVTEIDLLLPRIRDQIMRELHRNFGVRADGIASIDLLRFKAAAVIAANHVLGEELVRRVLVSSVARALA
jgi:flagellar basal body-associated protein FliL